MICVPKNSGLILFSIFKSNSCNAIYYCKRECCFYVRAAKHVGLSHFTNECINDVKQSVVSGHLLTCYCNINVNDFTILSKYFLRIFTTIGKSSFMQMMLITVSLFYKFSLPLYSEVNLCFN